MEYVKDLKALLEEGAFTEQKAFLRSFIKSIDYAPDEVAISYTIPMPVGENKLVLDEVLSMEPYGRPCRSRTCDTLIKSQGEQLGCTLPPRFKPAKMSDEVLIYVK